MSVNYAFHHPGFAPFWLIVFLTAVIVMTFKTRLYALKVQDRLIRLEERLRCAALLPESLRAKVPQLTEAQLIGLRFASDEELPGLVERTLSENLSRAEIKKAVKNWRPDEWRV